MAKNRSAITGLAPDDSRSFAARMSVGTTHNDMSVPIYDLAKDISLRHLTAKLARRSSIKNPDFAADIVKLVQQIHFLAFAIVGHSRQRVRLR